MPLAYINFVNPGSGEGGNPDQGLPEGPAGIWGGGSPDKPSGIYPGLPGQPLPKPPAIPGIPDVPIYIPPGGGWITIPMPPIINPPKPKPPNSPGFPELPIVIPPLPPANVPDGKALVLVITNYGSWWGTVDKNGISPIEPPAVSAPK